MQKVGVLFSGDVLAVFEVVPLKLAGNATAINLKFRRATNDRVRYHAHEIRRIRDARTLAFLNFSFQVKRASYDFSFFLRDENDINNQEYNMLTTRN